MSQSTSPLVVNLVWSLACLSTHTTNALETRDGVQMESPRTPDIELQHTEASSTPAIGADARSATPRNGVSLCPVTPLIAAPGSGPGSSRATVDQRALRAELDRLRRTATPRTGYGSTNAAAQAAWILGLIYLHGGIVPCSPPLAQTWFERATRFGRKPQAQAGLAWCHLDGCKGPPDPAAARQAITLLRPRHPARALYLEWVLESRLKPLTIRSPDPRGISAIDLSLRDMLLRAVSDGDAQARVELGLEAVSRGDLRAARGFFEAAAPRSRAAAANLQLLDMRAALPGAAQAEPAALLTKAQRFHRGEGVPVNYAEALRLYRAAAAKGSAEARRMLALITSRSMPDGTLSVAWMAELARLDKGSLLPQPDLRALAPLMYRDPTPLYDLLPERWQRQITALAR